MTSKRTSVSFTIIELIVVMAIVGVLAALMLAALTSARASARKTLCQSHLRQIAAAVDLYRNDYNSLYPPARVGRRRGSRCFWFGQEISVREISFEGSPLASYLRDIELLLCPTTRHESSMWKFKNGPATGYGYNLRYVGGCRNDPDPVTGMYGKPAIYIRKPSETIMFADSALASRGYPPKLIESHFVRAPSYVEHYLPLFPSLTQGFHFRHKGLANILFCDGHVKAWKPLRNHLHGLKDLGDISDDEKIFGGR